MKTLHESRIVSSTATTRPRTARPRGLHVDDKYKLKIPRIQIFTKQIGGAYFFTSTKFSIEKFLLKIAPSPPFSGYDQGPVARSMLTFLLKLTWSMNK